jgi:hypothetical protein
MSGSTNVYIENLFHYASLLRESQESAATFQKASEALMTALAQGADIKVWDAIEKAEFYRILITQSAYGLHRLAHQASHVINGSVPETAQLLVAEMRPVIQHLINNLDSLNADEKRRTVLFAITIRTFVEDWLASDVISRLHITYFTAFDDTDLDIPYSVMFGSDVFGQNQQDLILHFLPKGYLESKEGLSVNHITILAWLSNFQIFNGPVNLGKVLASADLAEPTQANAARSLILRFDDGNQHVDASLKQELGLEQMPLANSTLTKRFQVEKLQSKQYQIFNAGLNRVKLTLPFMLGLKRRPKVAICLSGQLRGYELALDSWKKRLLPFIESTFFIHSWHDVGRSSAQPSRAFLPFAGECFTEAYRRVGITIGYEEMKARYPALFRQLAKGSSVTEEHLCSVYETEHVVLEDDKSEMFANFSNQQKMHYKIHAADKLARDSDEFDLIMRIRPDLNIRDVGVSINSLLQVLSANPVIFAEKGFGVFYGCLMIGDQYAIGTPENMKIYADAWTTYPKLSSLGFAKMPNVFTGHVSLAQTCWLNGLDVLRAPLRFGQLNEASKLSSRDCYAAIEIDNRGTPFDLQLLKAAQTDLG